MDQAQAAGRSAAVLTGEINKLVAFTGMTGWSTSEARTLLQWAVVYKRLETLLQTAYDGGRWGHEDAGDHLNGLRGGV